VARHRAARRRGWSPAPVTSADPPVRVGHPSATTRAATTRAATTRAATTGVLAAAALGGAFTATERLDPVAGAVGGTLSGMASAASWSPVPPRSATSFAEPVPPEPVPFDLDSLLKGVAATERDAVARATQRAEVAARSCSAGTSGFGGVKGWVASAGTELRCRFDVDTVYGLASRAGTSDHPSGLALDFMVDRATGDRLADYALRNRARLGIKYVIYRQRINFGSGWQAMEDRGGATANHLDHVHISYQRRPTALDALS
jgi:hypothetical protein